MSTFKKNPGAPASPASPGAPTSSSLKKTAPSILSLPEVSKPDNLSFEDFTYLIYGERKIGKSSLFSQFKDPFMLFFEPGGKSITGVKKADIPNWQTFLDYISLLEKNPGYCKIVIIDTGYMAYERCFEFSMKKLGIVSPQDKSWGTAWKFIDKEFREAHMRLTNAGISFAVAAHSEIKEVQRRDGSKYDKLTTQLGGQAARLYTAIVDVVAYYQYDNNGARVLTIRGDSHVEAGCRLDKNFLDARTKEPLQNIPMGKSASDAYKNLTLAFQNKLTVTK